MPYDPSFDGTFAGSLSPIASVDWTAIEDAIWTWVWQASGLPGTQVIWSGQAMPQPGSTFIDLAIEGATRIGLGDSVVWRVNPGGAAGAEGLLIGRGQQRCSLVIRCFAGAATGATKPLAILNEVMSALGADEIAVPLARLVGIGTCSDVTMISGVVNSTLLEPRAQVTVKFFVGSETNRTITTIETVNITDEIPNPDETLQITRS